MLAIHEQRIDTPGSPPLPVNRQYYYVFRLKVHTSQGLQNCHASQTGACVDHFR